MRYLIIFLSILTMHQANSQAVVLPISFTTTKGVQISNAKVTSRSDTSIKVMHDGGIATLELSQLPAEVLKLLGVEAQPPAEPAIALPNPLITQKASYEQAELTAVEPDGIRIKHPLGSAKVPYEMLPKEVIDLVGPFDSKQAETFRAAETERNRQAYVTARNAILESQKANTEAIVAEQKVLEEQKAALLADPNLISPALFLEISAYSTGGKSRDTSYLTTWGSYARTDTSNRSMYCTVTSKFKGVQRARMQCIFLTRDVTGARDLKYEIVADANVSLGPLVTKQVAATGEAQQSDEKYAAIGIRYREGEKYVGWCWRAIDGNDRVCAVYSSTPSYDRYGWSASVTGMETERSTLPE